MPNTKRCRRTYILNKESRRRLTKQFFRLVGKNLKCPVYITDTERRKEETLIDSLAVKLIVHLKEENFSEADLSLIVEEYMNYLFDKCSYLFTGSIVSLMTNKQIIPYRNKLVHKIKTQQQIKAELQSHLQVTDKIIRRATDDLSSETE